MIFGIGTDIIEVERIERSISRNDGFKEKIFTQREIEYCLSKKLSAQSFAVRFAAKEAFFKALGTGWAGSMKFSEIEVLNDSKGKPEIVLHGSAKEYFKKEDLSKIHVSLSHIKALATATVLVEKF